MEVSEILFVGFVAVLMLALCICATVMFFRKGSRDKFITWGPFAYIATYAFGIPLVHWGFDWATDDPKRPSFVSALEIGAIVFVVFATIWFVGFFYGRLQRERRSGVLSRSR